ncbi:MAG: cobyrinate a,c-diamide synthase [Steroidobacteraceae bacterium]
MRNIPRIVVAGVASSVGKTTITAGLIAALRQRGLTVQPFKCGPDYIDPTYHECAAGRPCRNLDAWMLDDAQLLRSFSRACKDADIAVIEGVMGLFDGCNWVDERASTAQIAKLLGAPVLLVVDIGGAARSAAAVVLGCRHFDTDLSLRAVVLNFAGSAGHAKGCAEAIAAHTQLPTLGWLPRHASLRIPERHLGLLPGGEHLNPELLIAGVAEQIRQNFDLAAIIDIARAADVLPGQNAAQSFAQKGMDDAHHEHDGGCEHDKGREPDNGDKHDGQHLHRPLIAVARDAAFCFYYPENLELLVEAGARIEFFSPLLGEAPGAGAAGVYLGGGYPELHGATLAANAALWDALKELRARDAPIYAECGGFMVLTQGLIDRDGRRWPMAELIPGVARMTDRLAALGYRHALALRPNLLAESGDSLRGHEFRYSTWVIDEPAVLDGRAWQVQGSTRPDAPVDSGGWAQGNLLASYLHIHFGQGAGIARRLVERMGGSSP